jgi:phosphatidylglycerol---prolipoprotein diacylglyceryl transferase
MYPSLLSFGPFTLYSFGVMVSLAILAGVTWGWFRLKQQRVAPEVVFPAVILSILSGLLGGRLAYFFYEPQWFLKTPWEALTSTSGMVWYGGLLVGLCSFIVFSRSWKTRYPSLAVLDAMMPPIGLGLAIGRIGCFLAGCCYGRRYSGFGSILYPVGHPTHPHSVWAVPLFEMAIMTLWVLLACFLEKRLNSNGHRLGLTTGWMLLGFALCRFGLEVFRGDRVELSHGISASQAYSLAIGALGLWLLVRAFQQRPSSALKTRDR